MAFVIIAILYAIVFLPLLLALRLGPTIIYRNARNVARYTRGLHLSCLIAVCEECY